MAQKEKKMTESELTSKEKALAAKRLPILLEVLQKSVERKLARQTEQGFQNFLSALQNEEDGKEGNPIDVIERLERLEKGFAIIAQRKSR